MKAIIRVYADLIIKEIRTIDSVPKADRDEVKQELTDRGRPELAGSDTE